MSKSEKKQDASITWFEIPADSPERAKAFYSNLFGWKINPFPGTGDYWHIDTGGADDSPDGALKRRQHPQEPVVNYVSVNSVDKFADKISKLGGKICMAKTAAPQMGYFAVCQDPEGNPLDFGRAIQLQPEKIICPNPGRSFVVVLKVSKTINNQLN